jgi:hypothetical protein
VSQRDVDEDEERISVEFTGFGIQEKRKRVEEFQFWKRNQSLEGASLRL